VTTSLVLTLIGPDRPGLVELLSQTVVAHQGNWVESRMARLSGQFAGILRVELPTAQAGAFTSACEALRTVGLGVVVAPSNAVAEAFPRRQLLLEVIGHDRPGIVREVAQLLASRNVNVEELITGVESAPMSADLLFRAKARLAVPEGLSQDDLARLLEPIGNELMVDIALAEAT